VVLVPLEVDHVIARKHGGRTATENLALCCALCNRWKGTDLASVDPEANDIVPLYNPRTHRWEEHFELVRGAIVPLTPSARATIRLLRLNREDRIAERIAQLAAGLYPHRHD
jgi:hypothetical protein